MKNSRLYLRDMDITLDSIRDIQLYQSRTGYRFSVDSLLLYRFLSLKTVRGIADLGAGNGIVGILLAKKYHCARVDLFEIQDSLVKLAEKNVILNKLEGRIRVIPCDIRTIPMVSSYAGRYDLIVSNPPFRRYSTGRINIEEEKAIARHELKLSLGQLIRAASFCLREKGRLCIIYHPSRISELVHILHEKHMEPKKLRFVHSNRNSDAKMVLLEAVKGGRVGLKVDKPLYIYKTDGTYTEEMHDIYSTEISGHEL